MAIVAITGDIGAGKSTVSRLLADSLACPLLDADKITAELWQAKSVKSIFISRWGKEILDSSGDIIKSEISRRIFNNPDEYKFCNSILHPLVMNELRIKTEAPGIKDYVLEIPLLFEAGRAIFIDKVIYVTASFEIRAQRCFEQRGWNVKELKRRESFLMPRKEKISLSDFVIYNNGTLEALKEKVRKLN